MSHFKAKMHQIRLLASVRLSLRWRHTQLTLTIREQHLRSLAGRRTLARQHEDAATDETHLARWANETN